MNDVIASVLGREPRIAFALVYGSVARATDHSGSDVDVAIGLVAGARLSHHDIGELIARLETAAGRPVDVVLLDNAPPPGWPTAPSAMAASSSSATAPGSSRAGRAPSSSIWIFTRRSRCWLKAPSRQPPVVDRALLATKTAAVRDAIARIRSVVPQDPAALAEDRTAREVVILNVFVALQECLGLATHWLARSRRPRGVLRRSRFASRWVIRAAW